MVGSLVVGEAGATYDTRIPDVLSPIDNSSIVFSDYLFFLKLFIGSEMHQIAEDEQIDPSTWLPFRRGAPALVLNPSPVSDYILPLPGAGLMIGFGPIPGRNVSELQNARVAVLYGTTLFDPNERILGFLAVQDVDRCSDGSMMIPRDSLARLPCDGEVVLLERWFLFPTAGADPLTNLHAAPAVRAEVDMVNDVVREALNLAGTVTFGDWITVFADSVTLMTAGTPVDTTPLGAALRSPTPTLPGFGTSPADVRWPDRRPQPANAMFRLDSPYAAAAGLTSPDMYDYGRYDVVAWKSTDPAVTASAYCVIDPQLGLYHPVACYTSCVNAGGEPLEVSEEREASGEVYDSVAALPGCVEVVWVAP